MKKLRGKKGMSKKLFLLAVLVVSVVCFSVNAAFAAFEVYTTDDCTSPYDKVDTFDINGTSPSLYMTSLDPNWQFQLTLWYPPDLGNLDYYTPRFNTGTSTTWCDSFDNINFFDTSDTAHSWNDIKTLGEWKIGATYYSGGAKCGCDDTTFTMTPEPATSALFLIGGTGIALMRRRKAGKSKA